METIKFILMVVAAVYADVTECLSIAYEEIKNRKGLKMKKRISIPLEELKTFLVEGKSINWIALHYGCDWSTIRNRIYENPELLEVRS